MFDIGDKVWIARIGKVKSQITCPHCLGKKYLTVIMGDESLVKIDCSCCTEGLLPEGKITIWETGVSAEEITITGLDSDLEGGKIKTRYHYGNHNCYNTFDNVFSTQEKALAWGKEKLETENKHEEERIVDKKDQATKTWAQNATYHLDAIKRMERDIEYHKKKLDIAETHVKEK